MPYTENQRIRIFTATRAAPSLQEAPGQCFTDGDSLAKVAGNALRPGASRAARVGGRAGVSDVHAPLHACRRAGRMCPVIQCPDANSGGALAAVRLLWSVGDHHLLEAE
jgi:hypothetical protein